MGCVASTLAAHCAVNRHTRVRAYERLSDLCAASVASDASRAKRRVQVRRMETDMAGKSDTTAAVNPSTGSPIGRRPMAYFRANTLHRRMAPDG
jgi:hypothetical protein